MNEELKSRRKEIESILDSKYGEPIVGETIKLLEEWKILNHVIEEEEGKDYEDEESEGIELLIENDDEEEEEKKDYEDEESEGIELLIENDDEEEEEGNERNK